MENVFRVIDHWSTIYTGLEAASGEASVTVLCVLPIISTPSVAPGIT